MNLKLMTDFLTPLVGLGTACVGLVTAIVAITKYFNYRSKQDEQRLLEGDQRLVKQSFDTVIASLRSKSLIERMAGAIILRRFYDSNTEMGTGGNALYWKVAVGVTAAILRDQKTSNFQKVLADGLAFAPNLIRADLQNANLQFAYLGSRKPGPDEKEVVTDLRYADFYRADLSRASLKGANAERAVFYQARLHNAILSKANLTGANFFEADIKGASFKDAILYGANFSGARNIPAGFEDKLDDKGIYQDKNPFQPPQTPSQNAKTAVFVSKPGCLNPLQKQKLDSLKLKLESQGIIAQTLERENYPSFGAVGEVRRVVGGCVGAIIFGFSELRVLNGTWRANTPEEKSINDLNLPTPWTQIEAGIAIMAGIPLLVVYQKGINDGIFGLGANENGIYQICMDEDWDSMKSANAFSNWSADVREQSRHIRTSFVG